MTIGCPSRLSMRSEFFVLSATRGRNAALGRTNAHSQYCCELKTKQRRDDAGLAHATACACHAAPRRGAMRVITIGEASTRSSSWSDGDLVWPSDGVKLIRQPPPD